MSTNDSVVPEVLSGEHREQLFRAGANIGLLQERVARLRAETELSQGKLEAAQAVYNNLSQSLSQAYNLVEGDGIDVETGEISRAAQQEAPAPAPAPKAKSKAKAK